MKKPHRSRSVVAVDPGYLQTAIIHFEVPIGAWCPVITQAGIYPNDEALKTLTTFLWRKDAPLMALEKVAMGGMTAGPETFETCVWSGRFIQAWLPGRYVRIPRVNVKRHLTGRTNTKDGEVRQAIIERFGGDKATAVGVKATPGPLYGVKADVWAALAVGLTYLESDDEFNEEGKVVHV